MQILVTGGTGFLGSYLLKKLSEENLKIRAIYRNKNRIQENKILQEIPKNKIEWIQADLLDIVSLEDAFQNVKQIYHCGAMVSFNTKNRQKMRKINISGTANMVNLALDLGIEKFLHVSSIASLGPSKKIIDESNTWKTSKKNSQYSISKYLSELEVWRGIEEGLNAVIVNPSVIIGAGNWNEGTCRMFKTVWNGLKFYSSGKTGYVAVEDVVACMIQLMNSNAQNERFILNGENLSYKDFFTLVAKALNKKSPEYCPPRWMSETAWRVFKIFQKDPFITKETVEAAYNGKRFSNEKIKKQINFEFQNISESIEKTAKIFLEEFAQKVKK